MLKKFMNTISSLYVISSKLCIAVLPSAQASLVTEVTVLFVLLVSSLKSHENRWTYHYQMHVEEL